jgi:hypothetical protein
VSIEAVVGSQFGEVTIDEHVFMDHGSLCHHAAAGKPVDVSAACRLMQVQRVSSRPKNAGEFNKSAAVGTEMVGSGEHDDQVDTRWP